MVVRMRINKSLSLLWLLTLLVYRLAAVDSFSQEILSKSSRQIATEAYSRGDYEKAYLEFSNLLKYYPKDPVYNYYSGVCLVQMKKEPESASGFLKDAINGAVDIKSVPQDAWFYLGRSQQMSGKFTAAVESYNMFRHKAGKKTARAYDVQTYIDQCNYGKGRLSDTGIQKGNDVGLSTSADVSSVVQDKTDKNATVSIPVVAPQKEKVSEEYDRVLSQAMEYQVKADSLNRLAAETRREMDILPPIRREEAKARVSELETKAAEYQKIADEKFGVKSSAPAIPEKISAENIPDANAAKNEVYSLFEVLTDPAILKIQRISVDQELPAGLVYHIQMGVFSKQPDVSFFRGLSPVAGFKIPGTGATRYFVGIFRRMEDAGKALLNVKQLGFKDSFITAAFEGKQVSIDRAAILEKDWGNKPLFIVPSEKQADSTPQTLMFRVEVYRSAKPVGNETLDTFKKIAGNRDFDSITTADGTVAYLIGKFITFESATEYADLIKRNGHRESRVVSYLGTREIPLETAKQLFEK